MFLPSEIILCRFRLGIISLDRLTGKHEVRRLSVTHLNLQKELCWCFDWMLTLSSGQKIECVNKHYYLWPFTIVDTHHWRSKVGKDCSSLPASSSWWSRQPGNFSPQSQLKHSLQVDNTNCLTLLHTCALWFIKCPFMKVDMHKLIKFYLFFYLTCCW